MGYHDAREIPNYWDVREELRAPGPHVRAERVVESPRASVHGLRVVGEVHEHDPFSCKNELQRPGLTPDFTHGGAAAGVRLDRPHVPAAPCTASAGATTSPRAPSPTAATGAVRCADFLQDPDTPGIWNPLPYFVTVKHDHQLGNITSLDHYFAAARTGRCPSVSWIVPDGRVSEHPPALVNAGEKFVTKADRRRDEESRLGLHRDLSRLGRLGRLLRPRHAAAGGRQRLRPARPRPGHQPVREEAATSTTRRSASTRTTSSSRTTSSAGRGSTRGRTAGPTRDRTCARRSRSSATWSRTSTSPRSRALRWSSGQGREEAALLPRPVGGNSMRRSR